MAWAARLKGGNWKAGTNYIAVKEVPFVALQESGYRRLGGGLANRRIRIAPISTVTPLANEQVVWTRPSVTRWAAARKYAHLTAQLPATYYDGARVLVKDQTGKERLAKTNALGQLNDVWEVTAADSATEAISFPGLSEVTAGYHTSYAYDALNSLTTVTQGSQTRTSVY